MDFIHRSLTKKILMVGKKVSGWICWCHGISNVSGGVFSGEGGEFECGDEAAIFADSDIKKVPGPMF